MLTNPSKNKENSQSEQKLAIIDYWNPDNARVNVRNFALCGFRYRGANFKQGRIVSINPSVIYPTVNFKQGYIENGFTYNQWYAVFGVLEKGQQYGRLVPVPFLRVKSVNGNTLDFAECGMNGSINARKSYNFKDLSEHEVLLINRNSSWDGKIVKITSNTTDTLTLSDVSTLKTGDFILVAPQKYDYVYLGSFYVDNAETFNRGDDGSGLVVMRGVSITGLDLSDMSTGKNIDFRTFISPLATGVYFYVYDVYSISTTGVGRMVVGTDGSHDVEIIRYDKIITGSDAHHYFCRMPFSMRQSVNVRASGIALNASTRSMHVRGYVEQ